jgi:glycosyltransferase involved in cell wall biosynthesis
MAAGDADDTNAVIALARSALALGQAAIRAGDPAAGRSWLDRAHRLLPEDTNVKLARASACLDTDPQAAASLFQEVADAHDVLHAWLGLAAACHRIGHSHAALAALATALSRHALADETASLADRIAARHGWCGLWPDGRLEIRALGATETDRQDPGAIQVRQQGAHLLGSPIQLAAIRRLTGCVEPWEGGIRGWAWHPADPARDPVLTLRWPDPHPDRTITLDDETGSIADAGPLARPRQFLLRAPDLPAGPVHVLGPDGNHLTGSPLDPGAEQAGLIAAALAIGRAYPASGAAADPAPPAALRADAPVPAAPVGATSRRHQATVVIPVHNGGEAALRCLDSVLASLPDDARLLVVDDGSTDPQVIARLDALAAGKAARLIRHERAQGFPAAANAGIRAAKGRDVVLLNSDTLVPPGWLPRLRDAAYSAADIGTVTPLSNDATILSYPAATNPVPDPAQVNRLDRLAQRANGSEVADIPVGVGFCLYLRRDCLDSTGALRADVFAQGYGEENDLCLRARRLGWRSVALTGLFVGHVGGASFGPSATHLRARNARILERLHPGHDALVQAFIARDPLAPARRRIDLLRWKAARRPGSAAVILVTHDDGGGVEERVRLSAQAHAANGLRPIVLRPAHDGQGVALHDGPDGIRIAYRLPQDRAELVRFLRADRPQALEVHHFLGHGPAVYDLVTSLGLPYDVHAHDYAWLCPRVTLVGRDRYCGEPQDVRDCEACVADNGHFLKETISVAALRARSRRFLAAARLVVAPSDDTAARMRRHFPGLAVETRPHEDDARIPAPARRSPRPGRRRVGVVGGISLYKGYDVVLACARDAARRDLDLEFVVVGNTMDDARLLETGRAFVTGRYRPEEAVALIRAQDADLGFVASIWPETWCLTLGDMWRAGLHAVAFDIGAPAERIRRTGRGFLLPLGLSASAINNALVAAVQAAGKG